MDHRFDNPPGVQPPIENFWRQDPDVDLREDIEELKRLCAVVREIEGNVKNTEFVQYFLVEALRLRLLSNAEAVKYPERSNTEEGFRIIEIFKSTFGYLEEHLKFKFYSNEEIKMDHEKYLAVFTAIIGLELRGTVFYDSNPLSQHMLLRVRDFIRRNFVGRDTFMRNVQSNYARMRTFTMIIKVLHDPGAVVIFKANVKNYPFELVDNNIICRNRFAISEFTKCKELFSVAPENLSWFHIDLNRNVAHSNGHLPAMNSETNFHQGANQNHCACNPLAAVGNNVMIPDERVEKSRKRGQSSCVPESSMKKIKTHPTDQQSTSQPLNGAPPNEHDYFEQPNENTANQQVEVLREVKVEPGLHLNNQQAENPDEMQEQRNNLEENVIQGAAQVGNELNAIRAAAGNNENIHELLAKVGMERAWTPPNSHEEYQQANAKPPVDRDELDERVTRFFEEMNEDKLPSTGPITELLGSKKFKEEDLLVIYKLVWEIARELHDRIATKIDELDEDAMSAYRAACLLMVNSFASVSVTCVNEEIGKMYRNFIRVAVTMTRYRVSGNDEGEKAEAIARYFRLVNMGPSYPEVCCFNLIYRYLCEKEMTFLPGVDQRQDVFQMDHKTRWVYGLSWADHNRVNNIPV
ncbi:hypothetical protein CAEBREN_11772 [Caenorhabditis brenneri]|uniref:Uncharacterized protein n=1 Tax=Caenorhabditis brenneri TaxID=135651 RepID=G0M770_CAEBE|nr:hypothetical protein CAEBREN_11772 [Caenorhabditis brenneri]